MLFMHENSLLLMCNVRSRSIADRLRLIIWRHYYSSLLASAHVFRKNIWVGNWCCIYCRYSGSPNLSYKWLCCLNAWIYNQFCERRILTILIISIWDHSNGVITSHPVDSCSWRLIFSLTFFWRFLLIVSDVTKIDIFFPSFSSTSFLRL